MGLLSRVGRNFAGRYRNPKDVHDGLGPQMSMMDYGVGAPMANGGLGAMVGLAYGAASDPDSSGDGALNGMLTGAGVGAGGALAVGGGIAMKRLITAFMQEMKRKAPEIPDEAILKMVQSRDPEFLRFMKEVMTPPPQ